MQTVTTFPVRTDAGVQYNFEFLNVPAGVRIL